MNALYVKRDLLSEKSLSHCRAIPHTLTNSTKTVFAHGFRIMTLVRPAGVRCDYSLEHMYEIGILPAPASIEVYKVHAADVDCNVAAIPPAACKVPTPGTTVPNVAIATGTTMLAPVPTANTPPLTTAAFFTVSILWNPYYLLYPCKNKGYKGRYILSNV